MDEKDKQILNMIKGDARKSYQEIGDALGISRVAAKKRIAKLEEAGTVVSSSKGSDSTDKTKAVQSDHQYAQSDVDKEIVPEENSIQEDTTSGKKTGGKEGEAFIHLDKRGRNVIVLMLDRAVGVRPLLMEPCYVY